METLKICFVGTFPPTRCGLATFTQSLIEATAAPRSGRSAGVVRVMLTPEPPRRHEVVADWLAGDDASRVRALHALADFDVAILQHEFGIYPGPDGEDVVGFLRECPIPAVVVLHTVLSDPSPNQRRVLEQVMELADAVVVPTDAARVRLEAVHDILPERLVVIPHGAISNLGAAPVGRLEPTVLTWGLIGPGKGLEHGIEAMRYLRDLDPSPVYVIAGETHPKVRLRDGERYREALMKRAADLGIADRVVFEGRYLDAAALRGLARSADVILLPYESREQICSGVLVEAVSTGKPVVATAFPHAVELLSSACGIVVPHEDPVAIARALRRLFTDQSLEASMKAQARREAERLSWPAVGHEYLRLVHRVIAEREAA
jgi:glycosyltransferase involved in cell wall biosynthesis